MSEVKEVEINPLPGVTEATVFDFVEGHQRCVAIKLIEIYEKKLQFRDCYAKTMAENLNSFYGDSHPEEVEAEILQSSQFSYTLSFKKKYYMKDGSKLVWVNGMYEWGFCYPPEYRYYLKDKND